MALQFKSTGSTKLSVSGETLTIAQSGLASFKARPNKVIINKNYIFCNGYTFKKDVYIPVMSFYMNGNRSATINLASKTVSAGSAKFMDYLSALVTVLSQPEVSKTHYWSACKSLVTDSTILSSEQTACLNGTSFDKSKYSLSKQAPTLVKSLTAITSTVGTPIGVGLTSSGYTVTQSGVTSNVYYTMAVKLTWAS